jgi:hypothetical protein
VAKKSFWQCERCGSMHPLDVPAYYMVINKIDLSQSVLGVPKLVPEESFHARLCEECIKRVQGAIAWGDKALGVEQ